MARISGVDIPREKRLEISLTYIYGIGRTVAQQVCDATGMSRDTRVRDLTEEEVARLRSYIDQNVKVEGDLRRQIAQDIKRKMEIGCYEGSAPPQGPPGPRSAHPHERPHPQRSEEDGRRQEEGPQVSNEHRSGISGEACRRRTPAQAQRTQERHLRRGAHQVVVQQHDHHVHRPAGQHALVGVARATSASRARARARRSRRSSRPRLRRSGRWSTVSARST